MAQCDTNNSSSSSSSMVLPEHDPMMLWLEPENLQYPPKWRVDLSKLLGSVDPTGSYYTSFIPDEEDYVNVYVDGVGNMYNEHHAKALINIGIAKNSQFREGEDMVGDDVIVEKTWKIFFRVDNLRTRSGEILRRVKEELGVPNDVDVEIQLRNLLVYKEGSFFQLKQDPEKAEGTFGTMVYQFASCFTGGSMNIQHKDQKHTIDMSCSEFCVVAWYSDCPHEWEPIQSGYRFELVYNLVQKLPTKPEDRWSVKKIEQPDDVSPFMKKLGPTVDVWKYCNQEIMETMANSGSSEDSVENHFRMFLHRLDIQYTMSCFDTEISWEEWQEVVYHTNLNQTELHEDNWISMLKGRDRAVARLLQQDRRLEMELYIHEITTTISCDSSEKWIESSNCYVVKNGSLVKSDFQPRGYCGSSIFVASKYNSSWLTDQLRLEKLDSKYHLLAETEVEEFTEDGEASDGHFWYRTCFLAVKPKPDLQELALRAVMAGTNTHEENGKKRKADDE